MQIVFAGICAGGVLSNGHSYRDCPSTQARAQIL